MKKSIMAAACTVLTVGAFGQGYVNYQNAISTQFYFNSTASAANKVSSVTIGAQTGNGSSGVVDVGLYWSTAMFTDPAQATLADIATMSATAGTIAGNPVLPISGTSPGESVYLQVFAWDSTFADPDSAMAAGAYFGASSAGAGNTVYGAVGAPIVLVLSGGPPDAPQSVFGTAGQVFGRTVLLQSPEPGTFAIAGLGVAIVWFRRRRK
jgi:PEP-CTERM motif